MEILYGVVMVLVITMGLSTIAYLVIGKIGEENRRNSEYAMKCLDKVFRDIPKTMVQTFTEITKMQEKEQEKKCNNWNPTIYGTEEPEANG